MMDILLWIAGLSGIAAVCMMLWIAWRAIICIALGEFHHNYMEEIEDIRQELNKRDGHVEAEGDSK